MDLLLLCDDSEDEDDLLEYMYLRRHNNQPYHLNFDRFNLNSMSVEECNLNFRFQKDDIPRLADVLGIPEYMHSASQTKWSQIEAICVVLRRLAYPNRLHDIIPTFGRSKTELSQIFNVTCRFIYDNHGHLLTDFNQRWLEPASLRRFTEAVSAKGSALDNCWGFIDGTLRAMCRPGVDQEENYNGHKRVHGLKYQSIIAPNGLIANMYGPFVGRRHDSAMLEASNVRMDLQNLQDDNGRLVCIYGDPAYPLSPELMAPFPTVNLQQEEAHFNYQMSRVRQSVEWGFKKIISQFAILDYKKNLKLHLQPVALYYLVGTIMTNCHTCMYGSEVSEFFDVQPPTLEQYVHNQY